MTRMVVDGTRFEIRTGGTGPAVLLIHGFTGRGADWGPFLPTIRDAGRMTIVVDLLGHGRTDAPADPAGHAIELQAAALAAILRRLDAAPAVVVGYSMGARVALRMALTESDVVAGMVLESPSAGIADDAARATRLAADRALADRLEHDGLETFLRAWEATPLFAAERRLPMRRRERIHRERAQNRVAGLAGSLRGAGQGAMEPFHARLREIACPTLVIAGALDPIGAERARTVAAGIPGARLETLAHGGHAPHRERPADFRRLLIDQLTARRLTAR